MELTRANVRTMIDTITLVNNTPCGRVCRFLVDRLDTGDVIINVRICKNHKPCLNRLLRQTLLTQEGMTKQ